MPFRSPIDEADGWGPPHYEPIPFGRFRAELLALYEPPLRAKTTQQGIRHMLDAVARLLPPDATTAELTPTLIARLVQDQSPDRCSLTVKTTLMRVQVACRYALSRGYIRGNPFAFRKGTAWVRSGPSAARRHHSMGEIRRVLDLLAREVEEAEGWARWRARRLEALMATVAYTGLRAHEALRLTVEDVDLPGRIIEVVSRSGNRLKTSASAQPVPIPEGLAAILGPWLDRRLDVPDGARSGWPSARSDAPTGYLCPYVFPGVTRSNAWNGGPRGHRPLDQLKAAGERAGVPGLTFQSLRHSWGTHAEAWGLSPAMIQRVLRHTSAETQKHYRHADLDNIRAAVKGVGFGPPAVPPPAEGEGGPSA